MSDIVTYQPSIIGRVGLKHEISIKIVKDLRSVYPGQKFTDIPSMGFEMYTSIANAHLWIVPNAGYSFIYADPDKYAGVFIQTALEFLRDEW